MELSNNAEILIVGAGVAGLYAALKLQSRPVTIITARPLGDGGASPWAQGGLAAAIGAGDTPNLHFSDTMQAGGGLVDPEAASVLVDAGPAAVEDLLALGVLFDLNADGSLKLGREAAHCRDRIVHAKGDQAGAAIISALSDAARKAGHITILERIIVEDLLLDDHGAVGGALVYDVAAGERTAFYARETVLATGGLGGLFAVTTNPVRAQGHGLAFAARAGAMIRDPEFVQFHPTALDLGIDPAPLATEALRGEGAQLVNKDGAAFMERYHSAGDLAPRDVVARAVAAEINSGRGAFLDARNAIGAAFPSRYPTVFAACAKAGLDPRQSAMPIAPAAHYHMGGVYCDLDGRSSLDGLSVTGEVASSGVHGANRLASNSLLEAVVFSGRIAARLLNETASERVGAAAPEDRFETDPAPAPAKPLAELRAAMSAHAGILRDAAGLIGLLDVLERLSESEAAGASGMKSALVSSELIARGALAREESRGAHQRTDFPQTDDDPHHTEIVADDIDEEIGLTLAYEAE